MSAISESPYRFLLMVCTVGMILTIIYALGFGGNRNRRPLVMMATVVGCVACFRIARLLWDLEGVWPKLAVVMVVGCIIALLEILVNILERPRLFELGRAPLWVLVAAWVLAFWSTGKAQNRVIWANHLAAEELKRAEEPAADLIRNIKTPWEPGPGVTETAGGRFIIWLAVPRMIAVDWEYEQRISDSAHRQIPLRVVLLNKSWAESFITPNNNVTPLWRLMIFRVDFENHQAKVDSNNVLAEWSVRVDTTTLNFGPTEKRDYEILWDGRDRSGALAPPGDYMALVVTALPAQGSKILTASITFTISDDGPIVTPDPQTETIRQLEDNLRWGAITEEGVRSLSEFRRQQEFTQQLNRPLFPSPFGR